ncbi:GGDEF domain-containing protein [Capsulimonas corticalis]|uniref:GGDEF domain-containing protein n=1 Tax=Capsulimonas corticalis TaxID=2219043 RepID=UPI00140265AB|nr:GGDEF domain-containing protein [Capsulimonas corticalis]
MHTITLEDAPANTIGPLFRRRLIFTVSYIGLLLLALLLPGISHERRVVFDNCSCVLAPLAAALWMFRDLWASRNAEGGEGSRRARAIRLSCTFLALAAFADVIGEGIWCYYEVIAKRETPFPSLADIAYVLEHPLLLTAILLMPSRPISPAMRLRVFLDSLMIMASILTFSWYFVLGPTVLASHETLLAAALSAEYPIGDLILLGCVLILSVQERRTIPSAAVALLAGGFVSIVIADVVFAYQTLHGTYATGELVDIFWPLAYLLIALAATVLRRPQSSEDELFLRRADGARRAEGPLWRSLFPYALLPVVASLVVYCIRSRGPATLENGVYGGAALLVVLVLFRQIAAILDNARLNRDLQTAYLDLQEAQEAIELKNASLAAANERLESLAMTDGMTGLVNHRVFYERLSEACARAARYGAPFALLLLDVDRFKHYNDTFGHPAGDAVLKDVAHLLEAGARDTDIVARYGGEEFAMLLPLNDLEGARMMAERVRASIEAYAFAHRQITVSIGVAACSADQETPELLVSSADQALYEAKRAGRNRVVLAKQVAESAPLEMDPISERRKAS